ncbi:NUDIX hydrolase [Treponema sp.]|uniref:NUDIX hydrolase n=1 Tax=Treponema sp. TaxID=166 RepID=UPI0025E8BC03|nr:NUDIX hydrolase [Treponema sp.]MBQ7537937.1 NUDIX hydrolase [Treponema sp.]MBR4323884.1 NUDIX hydrolase [Treponema sp.]
MKFKSIKKILEGKFITRYDLEYETPSGRIKNYEMISRNKNITSFQQLHDGKVDAVVMIMHDKENEHILLSREFRMAPGEWVYNFPAGLIDKGEDAASAAERELREETGLKLEHIDEIWLESYSAVGFSNEKNICILGSAAGEIRPSDSELEEIEAYWYSKAEIRALLKVARFAARTQAYCALWSRQ